MDTDFFALRDFNFEVPGGLGTQDPLTLSLLLANGRQLTKRYSPGYRDPGSGFVAMSEFGITPVTRFHHPVWEERDATAPKSPSATPSIDVTERGCVPSATGCVRTSARRMGLDIPFRLPNLKYRVRIRGTFVCHEFQALSKRGP